MSQENDGNLHHVPDDPISQRAAWWFELLKVVGWPGFLLFVIGFGIYRVCIVAEPIVKQLVYTHVEVTNGLLKQAEKAAEQAEKTTEILRDLADSHKVEKEMLSDIHRAVTAQKHRASAKTPGKDDESNN